MEIRSGMESIWACTSEQLPGHPGLRFTINLGPRPATVADVLDAWQSDGGFRAWFDALLADVPFAAIRWETPAVTAETLTRPFECVVLDSPWLVCPADPEPFAEHLARAKGGVAVFPNLGGDAVLVAPCRAGEPSAYGHLAAFLRLAPQPQRDALWRAVGEAMARRVGDRPVWLSTAGGAVPWLHVRLDDRPKYYGYEPYRAVPGSESVGAGQMVRGSC